MKKLIVDTNVLFQLLKNPIDLTGFEPIIPDFVIKEFKFKAKEYKIKNIDVFIEKLKKKGFKILNTNYKFEKNVDDLILKLAKEKNAFILTIDKKLKKRAIKEGIKIKELIKGKSLREDLLDLY
jgi:rRNA-processing protein FCF1